MKIPRTGTLILAAAFTSLGMSCTSEPSSAKVDKPDVKPDPVAVKSPDLKPEEPVPTWGYKIVKAYPHDPGAFTQGLVYHDGYFLEGTGLEGRSSLRKVEIETGKVLKQVDLAQKYFGEGITLFKDKIYQITWQANVAFQYQLEDFKRVKSFNYPTEGWGLTHDEKQLIMSDGSATLFLRDPETFKEIGRVTVRDSGGDIMYLNELEYVKGEVWANVWQTNTIARIDPKTGKILGWIDLTGILKPEDLKPNEQVDVLNGIAYDEKKDRIFVTGKLWPKVYEIQLVKR